ncbi:hypothetical protein HGB25_00270 [Candidatus Saccharibacteria bacterium]|nr:hypothetical protein [Candidatus Saccharibacteria bacterium]
MTKKSNPILPVDTSVEAEYEDGYILNETEHGDISPYDETKNILNDILEQRPQAEHGKLVRFSCFYKGFRYDVDWTNLPDNARPIRFRDGQRHRDMETGGEWSEWVGLHFGYQYNDKNGKNIQEVMDL